MLQVADILLYKGTHVPIGDDQLAHLNLAKHLSNKANLIFEKDFFPIPREVLAKTGGSKVKSLRVPEKKMSKSEFNNKSRIELTDTTDEIITKIRKAVTDCTSEITYDPINRTGVSNLIEIYSLISGLNVEEVCQQFEGKDTFQFKVALGEFLAQYIEPIRSRINEFSNDHHYLETILTDGASKALVIAEDTISQVQQAIGSDMANLIGKTKYPIGDIYHQSRDRI